MIKGNIAKVADFGLSKILKENQYVSNSAAAFPVRYSAPEMVTGEKPASAYTDVWSYGTLIYEVLTYGQRPFEQFKTDSDVSVKFACDCCYQHLRIDDSFRLICNLDP